jgi:TfoX/Sxy family transcriptional regulator of competence genes
MQIPKATDADKQYFRALMPEDDRIEIKAMFGNLGAFVNNNMLAGLFGADVGLRLSEADRKGLLREPGAGPFGPAERPMGGYAALPASWRERPDVGRRWAALAIASTSGLPPKKPRSKPAR